jgi:hypothetical protein
MKNAVKRGARLVLADPRVTDLGRHAWRVLQFRPDKAPKHVESFVKLSLQGFFDGTKFHRVISDFMIQGGCPLTKNDGQIAEWGRLLPLPGEEAAWNAATPDHVRKRMDDLLG